MEEKKEVKKSCLNCKHSLPFEREDRCRLDGDDCGGLKSDAFEYKFWELKEEEEKSHREEEDFIKINPSVEQSESLIQVFDYLNKSLFEEKLPRPMLIFIRNPKILGGYFSSEKWFNVDGKAVDEIAINANSMVEGDEIELFQVLIHEMAHQWQFHEGIPGRAGYHNREWADKVLEIGLKPINVHDPDTETGDSITTILIKGGKAMKILANMPEELFIPFYAEILGDPGIPPAGEASEDPLPTPKPKSGQRTKYTCSTCGTNLWGKHGLQIMCIPCGIAFVETI